MPRIITSLMLISAALSAYAADMPLEVDPQAYQKDAYTPKRETPWKEGDVMLPGNPDDDDLLKIKGVPGSPGITHYLDSESLAVGEDGVTRYTVVLVTRSGVRNVLFEGLRCSEGRYKTYASAVGSAALEPVSNPDWRLTEKDGAFAYRDLLATSVLCSPSQVTRSPREAIQRLKYPNHYESTIPY